MLQPPQAPLPPESGTSSDSGVQSRGISRLPNAIAIAIAVVALAVAAGAWFRPLPKPEAPAAKTYTEQEVAEAKKAVCEAFEKANVAVLVAGRTNGGTDQAMVLAVAANVRLALSAGSMSLNESLADNPATPTGIGDAVKSLARAYQEISLGQLAGAPPVQLEPSYRTGDSATSTIEQNCS